MQPREPKLNSDDVEEELAKEQISFDDEDLEVIEVLKPALPPRPSSVPPPLPFDVLRELKPERSDKASK